MPKNKKVVVAQPHLIPIKKEENFNYRLPRDFDFSALHPNGKLLTDEQIKLAIEYLDQHGNTNEARRVLKDKRDFLHANYDVVEFYDKNNQPHYFAIYYGAKRDKNLGAGSFGTVKYGQNLKTGKFVAIKVINEEKEKREAVMSELKNEAFIANKLQAESYVFEREKNYYGQMMVQGVMVTQLAHGYTLADLIAHPSAISDKSNYDLFLIIINTLKAVQQAHQSKILHKDIKPDNLICDLLTNEVSLIDFCFSKFVYREVLSETTWKVKGNLDFIDPLIMRQAFNGGVPAYNESSEIYALGMTLRMFFEALKEKFSITQQVQIKSFLEDMIDTIDVKKRPNLDTAIQFFSTLQDDCVEALSKIKKIGIVDLAEYATLSINKKKLILKKLQTEKINEVYFVNAAAHTMNDELPNKKKYMEYMLDFMGANFPISNNLFYSPDVPYYRETLNIIESIPEYMAKKRDGIVRDYVHVTCNVDKNSLEEVRVRQISNKVIVKDDLEIIINNLDGQKGRLTQKYKNKDPRISLIQDTITNLGKEADKSNSVLPLSEVIITLENLQKQMLGRNFVKNFFSKLFGFYASNAAKDIDTIVKEQKQKMFRR